MLASLADAAQLASLADETPEGRSIVVLAKEKYNLRARDIHSIGADFVPFTAQTRMSGVNLDYREVRKGAADAVEKYVKQKGGMFPLEVRSIVDDIAKQGATPLVVAEGSKVLGVIRLNDIVKGGHQGAVRRDAEDGHQNHHDHRRQSAHCCGGGCRGRGR